MIYLSLNAQTGIDSTVKNYLLNLEIVELKVKSPVSNGSMGFLPMYQGDIPGAIAIIHSLPTGRVMATGNVPDIHIRFRAFRPYTFITSDSILAKRLQCNLTQQPYEDKDVLAQNHIFGT